MKAFTDSITHQQVNRSVRYPAAAGVCIDRQGGAFEDALYALVHVEIVHVMCKVGYYEQQGCGAVTFLVSSGSGSGSREAIRLRLRVKLFFGSGSGQNVPAPAAPAPAPMIKSSYEPYSEIRFSKMSNVKIRLLSDLAVSLNECL